MIRYCPESHRLYRGDEELTRLGKNSFNFSSSGFFTLLNSKGEPLYDISLPLFNKVCSHLLWIILWASLIIATNLLGPTTYLKTTNPLLMSLLVLHIFLLGCRLTNLLIYGAIKPIFSPPLWIKLTRQFQKGEGLDLLKKHHLEDHPGLLANLALTKAYLNKPQAAKEILDKALDLCPQHPALQTLYHTLAQNDFSIARPSRSLR